MTVVRRFLIASAFARAIRRERGVNTRFVEGHFPSRPDRNQFVRVEQDKCFLVLTARGESGEFQTEQSPVPLSHAEALVDVATGRVAYDRTEVPLGLGADGWLDRFILPSGLDLLTVNLSSDPRLFAPALWFGREVTDDPQFETGYLAHNGVPTSDADEVSNDALESLLDWFEGKSIYSVLSWAGRDVSPSTAMDGPAAEIEELETPAVGEVLPLTPDVEEGAPVISVEQQLEDPGSETVAPGTGHLAPASPTPADGAADRRAGPPRLTLRDEAPELEDDGLKRLARSLSPWRFRSLSAPEAGDQAQSNS
jgi:CYTH domain-containing protein